MALNTDKNLKIYFSIKEVAQQLGVAESTLRFWESEFPQIKPRTAKGTGIRQYTEKDIEQLKVVYNLIKVRGFKIAAAKKMLAANREGADRSADILETLISVRDQLKDLKKHIDSLV